MKKRKKQITDSYLVCYERSMMTHLKPHSNSSPIWFLLAVGSLMLGGLLSLFLMIGRSPLFQHLDPLFMKRCLVIHVNLTLTCWFGAFLAALFLLQPGSPQKLWAPIISFLGITLFTLTGFFSAQPVLSNYIPVIDHPFFLLGLALFIFGIVLTFFNKRLISLNKNFDLSMSIGLKCAALLFILSVFTTLYFAQINSINSIENYFETIFWGGGHLFQMSHVSALLVTWIYLSNIKLPHRLALLLFALLFFPSLLTLFKLNTPDSRLMFTHLMRWWTWPSLLVFFLWFIFFHRKFKEINMGFLASFLLIILGIALGTLIQNSNTLIPAHYHATIGSLTVAYMATSYKILPHYGYLPLTNRLKKLSSFQPLIYGIGQMIFSMGFGYAGFHGLGRKVYGNEQILKTFEEKIGLWGMGIGGLFALIGGALYFFIVLKQIHSSKKQLKT